MFVRSCVPVRFVGPEVSLHKFAKKPLFQMVTNAPVCALARTVLEAKRE